ncbi:ABC transporter family substrate-binding protein [Streptosporangiaceae bacterium NEAU-GS5]|nr:ABC transporter family substrate-binding protein [Streptosporangiaceae bacterium NEAU-GS5]
MRPWGLVLALVAGCAAGPVTTVATGPAGDPVASPVTAYDINPRPREALRDGGTVRWGVTWGNGVPGGAQGVGVLPAQWNANHIDGDEAGVKTVVAALMPRAFRSDDRGRVTPDTDYVTSASVEGAVVTYRLNPKAAWSDGTPITWADFAAQWQAMNGHDAAYRATSAVGYRDIAAVARGRDDREVKVAFSRRFADWRSLFSPLYPKATNNTPDSFNSDWIDRLPLTAGPFRLRTFDQTAGAVTVERDPKWWGQPAKLDAIVFTAAGVDAFARGRLDVTPLNPPDLPAARAAPHAVVRQAAGPGFRQLTLNAEAPVLSDVRVRQAVALGLDRSAIARADLAGLGWPAARLDNHFFLNSQYGYRSNAGELSRYAPDRAGQLLDAAGWRMAGGVRSKDGKALTLRFLVPAGVPQAAAEGEQARQMLRRIGVTLTIQHVSDDDFFVRYVIAGDFDIAPFSYEGSPFPMSRDVWIYADGAVRTGDDRQWNANLGRVGSAAIDEALAAAEGELDPDAQRDMVNAADRLVWEEVNVLPLYQRPESVAVRATLANVGARGFYDLRYQDVGYVK